MKNNLPKEIDNLIASGSGSLSIYKSGPASLVYLAGKLYRQGAPTVVIVPGPAELAAVRSLMSLLMPEVENTGKCGPEGLYKSWACLSAHPPQEPAAGPWAERWAFLYAARRSGPAPVLALTVDNLLLKWPPPHTLENNFLDLTVGDELPRDMLIEQAVSWGYTRCSNVVGPGELAVRGDVIDIFPPGGEMPARLMFFGDLLEEIRLFDPRSQRSRAEIQELRVLPAGPALQSAELGQEALKNLKHLSNAGELPPNLRESLAARLSEKSGFIQPGLYYARPAHLDEWFRPDTVFILYAASELRSRLEEADYKWNRYLAQDKDALPPARLILWPEERARRAWMGKRQILFDTLTMGIEKGGIDLPEKEIASFGDLFWKPQDRNRPWQTLTTALKTWSASRQQTILSFHSQASKRKFLKMAEHEGLFFNETYADLAAGLFALVSPLKSGMDLKWNDTLILPEDVLSPQESQSSDKNKDFNKMERLASRDELSPGDLLVHRDYGLCRFEGLTRLDAGDFLLLVFDGEDRVFLPVDRMGLLAAYKGPEGATPALDRLGGTRWKNVRERAKKAVEKIAHDLVEMYAYRKVAKGYSYNRAEEFAWEFEAGFGFDETPDQERAIADVMADLERPEPMDRLICGDVGFGKTEVAMRAAFRVIMDGRQVLMLCPTTILAEQHYVNFRERMAPFPIRVGLLSRFVPPKTQKVTLEAARKGQIDLLIGTHRLLSKDVEMPNLGLLILDEEQRFGVTHKEKIKKIKQNIDALTLTATPIPRTLQLSLSGVRGLSVMETPPQDRKAVETALIEREPELLRKILRRELEREGQVFWVHNRVQSLPGVADFIRELVPEARVGMAHGQMPERELEKVMHDFWHGEVDVLAATSIIESGLDFPRANTLIVDGAHMFGLGQLYQLRGRVGRSDRQAYAYFMVPSLERIADLAKKRLRVILELDYLGAGFQVAMEDLRLRGAGNILGEAQSGHIARVGLELFLEMLEDEVRRIKGEGVRRRVDTEISLSFMAKIPEDYIADPKERLLFYRALAKSRDETQLTDLKIEMEDRFGKIPEPLHLFLAVMRLKKLLGLLEVDRADISAEKILITWEPNNSAGYGLTPEVLLAWLESRADYAKLLPPQRLEIRFPAGRPAEESLELLYEQLKELEV